MAKEVLVKVVVDASQVERGFDRASRTAKKFEHDLTKTVRGAVAGSGAFQGLGRSVAFASGAFLGAAGLTAAVRSAFEEMSHAQAATAQTNAVLKSTAGIAGVTAKNVDALAKSMLQLTGIDDEATKGAENLLLTFTNIRNVVGKGNDIFNQATQAAADLATRLNRGAVPSAEQMAAAARQIGKALQDPIRGLTTLRRVGVTFTAQQEKQIKTWGKTGHVLEAQRAILERLQTVMGGAAAAAGDTLAGRIARLQENVRNLGGSLAAILVPSIQSVVDWLNKWFASDQNQEKVRQRFQRFVNTVSGDLQTLWGMINAVNSALGGWGNTLTVLAGLWVGFKLQALGATVAVTTANIIAAGAVEKAWQAALISTGWGALALASGIAAAYVIGHWEKVKRFFANLWLWWKVSANQAVLDIAEPFSHLPSKMGGWARGLKKGLQQNIADAEQAAATLAGTPIPGPKQFAVPKFPTPTTAAGTTKLPTGGGGGGGGGGRKRKTAQELAAQQNAWFDAMINRELGSVQDIASLRGQLGRLKTIAGQVAARLAITNDISRRLTLQDKLVEIARQRRDVSKQMADNAKQLAEDAKTEKLGWLDFAIERAAATKTLKDDLKTAEAKLAYLKKQAAIGKKTVENARAVWEAQQDVNRIQKEMQKTATSYKFRPVGDANAFIRSLGLNLTAHQIQRIRAGVVQIGSGRVPQRAQAFAGAGGTVVNGGLHLHGVQDTKQLQNALTKHAKSQPHPRRGAR